MTYRGIPITFHRTTTTRLHDAGDEERVEFLRLLEVALRLSSAGIVICFGGSRLAKEARELARLRGVTTVLSLHIFNYSDLSAFG